MCQTHTPQDRFDPAAHLGPGKPQGLEPQGGVVLDAGSQQHGVLEDHGDAAPMGTFQPRQDAQQHVLGRPVGAYDQG